MNDRQADGHTPKLKPCPFCGGDAYIRTGDEIAVAQCRNAGNHQLIFDGDNNAANEVADLWNQRATESVMLAALREARKVIEGDRRSLYVTAVDMSGRPFNDRIAAALKLYDSRLAAIDIAMQEAAGGSE